jgi:hypothetical protein
MTSTAAAVAMVATPVIHLRSLDRGDKAIQAIIGGVLRAAELLWRTTSRARS